MEKLLCFLAVLTLTVTGESKNVPEKCNPEDLQGLTSFKKAIRTDPSGRLNTWTGDACCTWKGIACDNITGRVRELNLPGFYTEDDGAPGIAAMHGSLSPSITLLTFLEVINLSGVSGFAGLTGLSGEIPPSIGLHLPSLRKLSLLGNNFEGPIPESIGKLSKLQELHLYENMLSGEIPESTTNLTMLESLQLQNNMLTGTIPGKIGDLQRLQDLDLSSNLLTGRIPSSITNLRAIVSFYLNNNRLTGAILPLSRNDQMPFLRFLRLNDNGLTGNIHFIGFLTALERVSLANNELSGSIPSSLGNLSNLSVLYLDGNRLSGEIPSTIGRLSELNAFKVSYNLIEGRLPKEMSAVTTLRVLGVSHNRLNLSYIPDWLTRMPSLCWIYLGSCRIRGGLPEELSAIPSPLQELDLSANQITGRIPEWIGKLSSVYSLNLSKNNLVEEIPSTITNLTGLIMLDLHSNKLSGSLQPVFQIQSPLEFLDLSDNNFRVGLSK